MRLTCLLLLLAGCARLFAQATTADSSFLRQNYTKREVMIPMRDGVQLFTSIYTPKNAAKASPILLKRTPYSCAPYGENAFPTAFQNRYLAQSGYIWVFQDVRGKYMSEGDFVDVRPFQPDKNRTGAVVKKGKKTKDVRAGKAAITIDEASDTYDTVDWLLKNAVGNNGRVGVYGISYPGFYATMAALAGHPAIKAVSPQAPVTDWFIGDDFHHNGAFMLMDAFGFYSGFGKPRAKPTTENAKGFTDWQTPDGYDFFLRAGALPNFARRYGMDKIPFWNDLMAHPDYDAWWQARNPRPHLKNVQPAMLTVGGLFDAEDCFGAWRTYAAIEQQNPASHSNRIVMGPWVHGGWTRTRGDRLGNVTFGQPTSDYYQKEVEMRFFEHYLKDNGPLDLPEALVFETGSNHWTRYDAWPPRDVQPTPYYFQDLGGLSTTPPPSLPLNSPDGSDTYVSDPHKPVPYTENVHLKRTREYMTDDQRFAARRPDVVVYQTPPLTDAVTVTGPVVANLWVQVSTSDADFVVKLIDVFPDTMAGQENGVPLGGYQMLVRGEIMRGRYRNSFEQPEAFPENVLTNVRFTLPDVAHTFLPGHRLMVQVQSSWFPLADRNPQLFTNIYAAEESHFVKSTIVIAHSNLAPSGIILPVRKD